MRLGPVVTAFLVLLAAAARAENLEFCYIGQGAHEAGQFELAVSYYSKCIETGELSAYNLATVYFNRANAHSDLGDFERSIQDYDAAIDLDPTGPDLYVNRGLAYANRGNYGQAVLDFNEAIFLDAGFALAYQNRCMAMTLLGRLDEALKDCHESVRLLPDNPRALDGRALTFWLMGLHEEARRDLESAQALDPNFPDWEERFRQFEKLGQ